MNQQEDLYPTNVTVASARLTECIKKIREGGSSAQDAEDELFACVMDQLLEKAREVLSGFSRLYGQVDPGDIVNGVYERLVRQLAWREITDRKHFFGIACKNFDWWLRDYVKHLKRRKTRGPLPSDASRIPGTKASVAGEIATAELAELAAFHLKSLPKKYHDVIKLHLFLDMPYREIGTVLGIPHTTAQKRWNDGIQKLREKLISDTDSD